MSSINLWDKQKKETPIQYQAFLDYIKYKCDIKMLAKKSKSSKTSLYQWKKIFRWDQRVAALNEAKRKKNVVVHQKTITKKVNTLDLDKDFDYKNPLRSLLKLELQNYLLYQNACSTILQLVQKGDVHQINTNEVRILEIYQKQFKNLSDILLKSEITFDKLDNNKADLQKLNEEDLRALKKIHEKLAS